MVEREKGCVVPHSRSWSLLKHRDVANQYKESIRAKRSETDLSYRNAARTWVDAVL